MTHCPKCSKPRGPEGAQFCTGCGAALDGQREPAASPQRRGVRQGVVLMLLSVVLIPAYVLLAALFPAEDRLVESSPSDTPFEKISQAVLITLFLLGLARVLYARFFERGAAVETEEVVEAPRAALGGTSAGRALPPAQSIPVSGFGAWRGDTDELPARPRAATESSERE